MQSALSVGTAAWILLGGAAANAAPPAAPAEPEWTPAETEQLAPHHARSFLEMGAGLALGTGGYWLLKNRNLVDWDDPAVLSRFDGSAWVLDNNSIGVNFLGHPLTGALSYSLARGNHQSVAGALAYSFLTSSVWELAIEFKEKVSVNDMLVTPGAGLPIGEFFYKLGLYLDSGHHDSVVMDAVRAVLGSGVALDRALDGRPAPRVTRRDALGFSRSIGHAFELRYGVSSVSAAGTPSYARDELGVAGKLVTLPGYGEPARFARGFYGAELSTFALRAEASRYGWGLWLSADTTLLGYHAQDLKLQNGSVVGASFTVGTGVGWDYLRSEANRYGSVERAVARPKPDISYHVPNRREQYAALQLPGVSAEAAARRGWGSLEASASVQPSFAGLGAPAFYEWSEANPEETSKHILHRQGYFYGWGGAAHFRLRAALGPLRGNLELLYGAYSSQDGLDRHAEQLSVDVHAHGELLDYRASLGVAPRPDTTIYLDFGERRFHSSVGGFELSARSVERGLSARWAF